MEKRDRERIARIEAGEEQPIRNEKEERVARLVSKIEDKIGKKLTKRFGKMDLVKQVKQARKLSKLVGIARFKATFLEPGGFPKDIQDKKDSGMTNDEILNLYWGCTEFVAFWEEMALSKTHLETLVNKQ